MGGNPYAGQPAQPTPGGQRVQSTAMQMNPAALQAARQQAMAQARGGPPMGRPPMNPMARDPSMMRPSMTPAMQQQIQQRMAQMMAMRGQGAGAPYPSANLFSRGGIGGLPTSALPVNAPPPGYATGGPVHWKPITESAGTGITSLPAVTAVTDKTIAPLVPKVVTPAAAPTTAAPPAGFNQFGIPTKMNMTLPGNLPPSVTSPAQGITDAWNKLKPEQQTVPAYLQMRASLMATLNNGMASMYSQHGGSSHGGGGSGGNYGSSGPSSGGGRLA